MPGLSQNRWSIAATPEEIASLRCEVVAFAERVGLDGPRLADVRLAVSEAVTNAVVHAYAGRPAGEIRVTAGVVEEGCRALQIEVEDDGAGVQPRSDSPGLGLGLPTIATLADAVELGAVEPCGARLSMRFTLD